MEDEKNQIIVPILNVFTTPSDSEREENERFQASVPWVYATSRLVVIEPVYLSAIHTGIAKSAAFGAKEDISNRSAWLKLHALAEQA